jgi:methionyl-tRNA synthetase
MEQVFRQAWGRLDISFDDFIRTTEPRHRAG